MTYSDKEYTIIGEYCQTNSANQNVVNICSGWITYNKCKKEGYDIDPNNNETGKGGDRWMQGTSPVPIQLRSGDKVIIIRPLDNQ